MDRNPTATTLKSNKTDDSLAPYVASFSSRGPNPITFDILKVTSYAAINFESKKTLLINIDFLFKTFNVEII